EKEADSMADQVVANSQKTVQQKEEGLQQTISRKGEDEEAQAKLQRQEEEEAQAKLNRMEEEEPQAKLNRMEEEEAQAKLQRQEEEEAQAKTNNGVPAVKQSTNKGIEQQKGKGKQLPDHSLREMNHAFGTDFKDVNIHTDDKAKQLAQSINAQAFTTGKDVFFNKDKFNPDSPEGKHLLAHELTHVVQQQKHKSNDKS
ncbi:MAG: DUF4157 domain-containing protein, partial [Bacteroidota bacterium]